MFNMKMFECLFKTHHSVSVHLVKLYILMETISFLRFQKCAFFSLYEYNFFFWPPEIRHINILYIYKNVDNL